jgi:hypothetical protein
MKGSVIKARAAEVSEPWLSLSNGEKSSRHACDRFRRQKAYANL